MAGELTVIQMYGTGEADNIASVDMPDDGIIQACHIIGHVNTLAGDAEGFRYEVSFGSTAAMSTNDARSVIARASFNGELVGAAATFLKAVAESWTWFGENGIKVFGGERVYLHGLAAGGVNTLAYAMLHIRFQKFTARRR